MLTADSASVLAKAKPRTRLMASWCVTISYVATPVAPSSAGHAIRMPAACAPGG